MLSVLGVLNLNIVKAIYKILWFSKFKIKFEKSNLKTSNLTKFRFINTLFYL